MVLLTKLTNRADITTWLIQHNNNTHTVQTTQGAKRDTLGAMRTAIAKITTQPVRHVDNIKEGTQWISRWITL